jgi:hypothetical protein
VCCQLGAGDTSYSKGASIAPLRMSQADLQAVLDKAASLIKSDDGVVLVREELELRTGDLRVKMAGHSLQPAGARIPETIDRIDFTAFTMDPAPVTRFTISCSHYERTLSVAGQSPEHVDALFVLVRDELTGLSTPLGGSSMVILLRMFGSWVFGTVFLVSISSWFMARRRILFWRALISGALFLALFVLPFDEILAGFLVVRGDSNWISRHSAGISFASLVAGVISIVFTFRPLIRKPATPTDASVPSSAKMSKPSRRRSKGRSE